jgi:hypothetical protein
LLVRRNSLVRPHAGRVVSVGSRPPGSLRSSRLARSPMAGDVEQEPNPGRSRQCSLAASSSALPRCLRCFS